MQINGNFIPRYVTINEKGAKAMKNIVKYGIIICTCLLISPYRPAKKIVFSDVANKILISDLYRFEIDINSKNPNFMIKDNVLYTKDKKILLKSGKQEGAVKIINGVETIEKKAFANSSLQEITFPRSLKNIQNRIFLNCKKLKKFK